MFCKAMPRHPIFAACPPALPPPASRGCGEACRRPAPPWGRPQQRAYATLHTIARHTAYCTKDGNPPGHRTVIAVSSALRACAPEHTDRSCAALTRPHCKQLFPRALRPWWDRLLALAVVLLCFPPTVASLRLAEAGLASARIRMRGETERIAWPASWLSIEPT